MRAIILAAGRGSRMKSMTSDRPKCLVDLNGITLIQKQVDTMRQAGINKIGIVTGYRREMLENFADVEFHNSMWSKTNMVTSLSMADEWLQKYNCIVSYSDIFYEASAITSLTKSKAHIAITYDPNWKILWEKRFIDPLSDAETFVLDDENTLIEIGGKATSIDEIKGQYMGLTYFRPNGWKEMCLMRDSLPHEKADRQDMTAALSEIIKRDNIKIHAVKYNNVWGEIDSENDLNIYSKS